MNPVVEFLRGEFEKERKTRFSILRRIPNTQVFKFLDYYATRTAAGQDELREALIEHSAAAFCVAGEEHTAAYLDYSRAAGSMHADKYLPARQLGALAKYFSQGWYREAFRKVPKRTLQYAAGLNPADAPELKRCIKAAFSETVDATASRLNGDLWEYAGHLSGSRIRVEIDYGSRIRQLHYEIDVHPTERPVLLHGLSYESLLGVSRGDWDFITAENLDRSVSVLCEIVVYIAGLPSELPYSRIL